MSPYEHHWQTRFLAALAFGVLVMVLHWCGCIPVEGPREGGYYEVQRD